MNREDIVERLAEKGYTKKSARLIIDDFVRVIGEALIDGEEVKFHGFGTFSVYEMTPREIAEVQSREMISIPGHKIPRFTPGNQLRRWVREGIIRD